MAIDKILGAGDLDSVADSVFSAVNNSVSEIKAMQKRKAAENVQIVVQALKKIEADLRGEYGDVADKLAERIALIKDGQDGRNGADGRNGKDGRPGRDGLQGAKGNDGLLGRDGVNGVDGVSVTNAYIDFDGSLIIDLSSGQSLNVGEVVAPDLAERIKVISTMSTNAAVVISDEGVAISSGVKNINFVGATVTATASGDDVTVNVSVGTGSVTSVDVTGGTTGLSTTGGPITTAGTIVLGGTLAASNGGTGLTSLGAGVATFLATPSSANLAAAVTNETGTGALVFANSPTFVTPALGIPASGVVTNLTGTASININGTVGATTPAAGSFTTLNANGNVTLGDATADTITATGRFNTDVVPSTNNARDLGTAALQWRQVFATTLTENASPVVVQTDIGTAPNQIPLNQYLGEMAYMNAESVIIQPQASAAPNGIGDMVFQLTSNTSLEIKVKGSDGTVRSVTLTLA